MSASILAFALAQALDVQTTCLAMHHRNAYEMNSLLPKPCVGIASVKAGVAVGGSLAFWQLKKDHPKLAKWLAITSTAATGVRRRLQLPSAARPLTVCYKNRLHRVP